LLSQAWISFEIQEIRVIDNANKFDQPDRAAMAKDGVSVQLPRLVLFSACAYGHSCANKQ
jgi:hypothetical protein